MSTPERIQKIIARAGLASRRQAEALIAEGSVTVNGKIAQLGDQAIAGKDAIKVNGKLLLLKEPLTYIAFHKPKGVISTLVPDPQGRATLGEFLKKIRIRVFPVGRMDFNSEGLILLTNDGALAEKIQKSKDVVRVYSAKIKGHPEPRILDKLSRPQRIDGKQITPYSVKVTQELAQKSFLELTFVGQIGIDVRSFLERQNLLVERIIRKAIGNVSLKNLPVGHYRILNQSQVTAIVDQPDLALRRAETKPVKIVRTRASEERTPRKVTPRRF